MMSKFLTKIGGFVFVALFVVAQGAMQAAMASDVNRPGLSEIEKRAYILPDGTLPIFCDPQGEKTSISMCEGCLSEADFLLPSLGAACVMRVERTLALTHYIEYHLTEITPKHPTRGPPLA